MECKQLCLCFWFISKYFENMLKIVHSSTSLGLKHCGEVKIFRNIAFLFHNDPQRKLKVFGSYLWICEGL